MVTLPHNTPQFFFDETLISYAQRVQRHWLPAEIFFQPVIEPDRPWEERILTLYGTVLPNPAGGYRMYYNDFVPGGQSRVYLAASMDGFRWEKPALGLLESGGSTANNLVLASPWHLDSPSVAVDPDDPAHPYKLVTFHTDDLKTIWGPGWGIYAYQSADGLSWQQIPGVRLRAGDRTNVMTEKVDGRFYLYTRHVEMGQQTGGRTVYLSTSEDFLTWSAPELVLAPDRDDPPNVQIYGMSVFRHHGWFFGLVEYWHDTPDVIETYLAISRDGRTWTRPLPRTPFIAATYPWNRAWSTCASNGPLFINEQMVFYFGGRWAAHSYDTAQQYGAIGYASLAQDRFCALEAHTVGRVETVPLTWPGGELVLNADTRQDYTSHPFHCNGEVAVEVLDADGAPLPGWSGKDQARFHGNTHCRCQIHDGTVRWPTGTPLATLRGQTIRLRFHLDHARLFTFEARE